MQSMGNYKNKRTFELCAAMLSNRSNEELAGFLRDLLTIQEMEAFAQRWEVVQLLDRGVNFKSIEEKTGASSATITRINYWLHHGTGGYPRALARIKKRKK
jgi:TrpR-related protein YerC/YecD